MSSSRIFVAAFAVSFACVLACSGNRTEGMEQSKLPDNLRDDYAMFARKCSKCHSLARPLNATVESDQQWVNYVNRMRRQPGSGISLNDQAHIIRFLKWYAAELRRQDAEKLAEQTKAPPPPSAPIPPPVPSYIPEPDGGAP